MSSFEMKEEGGHLRGAGLVNTGWSLWDAAENMTFLSIKTILVFLSVS